MKRFAFTLAAVAAFAICGLALGQETSDEDNVEYQKLKVLEPLVGKWHQERESGETGRKWEAVTTVVWSATKKMLIVEPRVRAADAGDDLSKQEWGEGVRRWYFVWNQNTNRIECFAVGKRMGAIRTSEAIPDGEGGIAYREIRTTGGRRLGDRSDKVTDNEWTITIANIKDDEGNPRDDLVIAYKKM